mgnify:CR=1 FL=1
MLDDFTDFQEELNKFDANEEENELDESDEATANNNDDVDHPTRQNPLLRQLRQRGEVGRTQVSGLNPPKYAQVSFFY